MTPRGWALFGSQIFRFLDHRLWNQALGTARNFVQANLGAELEALVMYDLQWKALEEKKKQRWKKNDKKVEEKLAGKMKGKG